MGRKIKGGRVDNGRQEGQRKDSKKGSKRKRSAPPEKQKNPPREGEPTRCKRRSKRASMKNLKIIKSKPGTQKGEKKSKERNRGKMIKKERKKSRERNRGKMVEKEK